MALAMTPVPGQTSQPMASDSSVQKVMVSSSSEVVSVVVVLSGAVVLLTGSAKTGVVNERNAKIETMRAARKRRMDRIFFCTDI